MIRLLSISQITIIIIGISANFSANLSEDGCLWIKCLLNPLSRLLAMLEQTILSAALPL